MPCYALCIKNMLKNMLVHCTCELTFSKPKVFVLFYPKCLTVASRVVTVKLSTKLDDRSYSDPYNNRSECNGWTYGEAKKNKTPVTTKSINKTPVQKSVK